MAEYMIQDTTLTAIGDAIRAKTGDTATLTPAQMATAIEGISTGHPNGREFTACTFDSKPSYLGNIVKGGGLFVLGTTSTGMYYSEDGKAWTRAGVSTTVYDHLYAVGLWVAACLEGLYYSADGKAWTLSNVTDYAYAVGYANGLWVSVTNTGPWYSEDGKTWTQSNITDIRCKQLVYGNGVWLASDAMNHVGILYSTDGKTWSQSNITDKKMHMPVWGETGMWVSGDAAADATGLYYSADGKTWSQSNITSGSAMVQTIMLRENDIICADGMWMAVLWVSSDMDNGNFVIYYSADNGITWTKATIGSAVLMGYANGIWLAGDNTGMCYSTDGIMWTHSEGAVNTGISATYAAGIWICGDGYSTDNGKTWKSVTLPKSVVYHIDNMWFGREPRTYELYYSVTWEP